MEAFPLPDKTAQSVADAFFNQVVCRFGMPSVIHSDQGREFENKIMQELCQHILTSSADASSNITTSGEQHACYMAKHFNKYESHDGITHTPNLRRHDTS